MGGRGLTHGVDEGPQGQAPALPAFGVERNQAEISEKGIHVAAVGHWSGRGRAVGPVHHLGSRPGDFPLPQQIAAGSVQADHPQPILPPRPTERCGPGSEWVKTGRDRWKRATPGFGRGPNLTGKGEVSTTPVLFHPRNWDHSAAAAAGTAGSPGTEAAPPAHQGCRLDPGENRTDSR